jgi:hypothetical protein
MKRIALASVLILALTGCGGSEATGRPSGVTTPSGGLATTAAAASASGTTASTATATAVTATPTTAATASHPRGPVTVGPNIPSAVSRSDIPWSEVGPGWHVVLYNSSNFEGTYVGPVMLYLVSPTGTRYEVSYWTGGNHPDLITDVRPDGTAAIVESVDPVHPDTDIWYRVDLATGVATAVYSAGFPELTHAYAYHVQFTRPSGENLVIYRNDGTREWIERRSNSGSVLGTVYSQPVVSGGQDLQWLYGQTGTTVLVKHHGGIANVTNIGALINEIWIPMDRDCDPVKWWDADTFLAACRGGPAVAPHDHYHQLWLLETDGSAGIRLTTIPSEPVLEVDFGYLSAHKAGSTTLLQMRGDCGVAQIQVLKPDGSGAPLPLPWLTSSHGQAITAVAGGQMGIYSWKTCGRDWGSLAAATPSGAFIRDLVPLTGTAVGVRSVLPVGP